MTNEEFIDSLTPTQVKHFNTWVVSIREEYHAIYEKKAAELVEAKAVDLKALADQIKELSEIHTKALSDKQDELEKVNIERVALQAEVARLESIKSFDDSLIGINPFLKRIEKELLWLMVEAQSDEQSKAILGLLLSKKGTKEQPLDLPVNLKSPTLLGALDYLVSRGFDPKLIPEITKPASREEAYDAD